ncbi:Hippocampus abundant transcript 1 protein [Morus notabilis]|uniref:Hippocampus abundant transcript 1 protein n=1 Tax=Morus notabilis TaxID=981085 RepID=W9RBU2_9ROSA|nr:Hippocampus abundant transcript 1 protein [Morus notabilis]
MERKLYGLGHLFMSIFLHTYSTFMVVPAITDVTMSALCPGKDECSLAIYLTGFQQVIIGLGTLVMMPIVGKLSDKYGRKSLLTMPMAFTIIPLGILACSRTRNFIYAYYAFKTLFAMISDGSVHCLALAYVADNVPEARRASAFGILSGISSCGFVCGTLTARFLSTASTFQVAASLAVVSLVYMRVFLPDSVIDDNLSVPIMSTEKPNAKELVKDSSKKENLFKSMPSADDMVALLNTSPTFSKAAVVAFFSNLADVGLHSSMMYYLKAEFHFNKDQFADLMVISGIAGTISQFILMPILAPLLGEERLLSVGLLFSCAHTFVYSLAWSFWMRSIVSKQVGSHEQGKAQGCISGIGSLANVISPLAFSPLTALFLSDKAPFDFPGFSIMCIGFSSMIAFIQSVMIRAAPAISNHRISNCNHVEP